MRRGTVEGINLDDTSTVWIDPDGIAYGAGIVMCEDGLGRFAVRSSPGKEYEPVRVPWAKPSGSLEAAYSVLRKRAEKKGYEPVNSGIPLNRVPEYCRKLSCGLCPFTMLHRTCVYSRPCDWEVPEL